MFANGNFFEQRSKLILIKKNHFFKLIALSNAQSMFIDIVRWLQHLKEGEGWGER